MSKLDNITDKANKRILGMPSAVVVAIGLAVVAGVLTWMFA